MMKSILCILAAALALIAQATPVTPFQAKQAARAWAQRNAAFAGEDSIAASSAAVAVKNADGVTLWYRVAMQNGSCIVVSPVAELEPVIACLENVPAEGLPSDHPVRAMLERDMADRLKKLGLYTSASTGPALMGASPTTATPEDPVMAAWAEQGKAKWARLAGGTGGLQLMAAVTNGVDDAGMAEIVCVAEGFEKGGPLTHWNQEEDKLGERCYNLYTPNNYPCGCVATAMAAMLQFFGANATKANYSPEGAGCKVDGAAINAVTMSGGGDLIPEGVEYYDWSLLDDMTSLSDYADDSKMNDDIRDLLGRVAYDAGVMLSMNWGKDASGADTADIAKALKAFEKADIDSGTSSGLRACAVLNPSESHYEKLIYFPCRLGKPVGLGINQTDGSEGHAVLAVGFGWDNEYNARVRIFAGWGGVGDGWYALPYINTKSLPSQAGSFLFDVVKKVITLIGYEDEDRVPLVGHVGKPEKIGGTLTLMPAGTPVTVSDEGYFGLCVATPPPSDVSLESAEYKASIQLSSSLADLLGKDSLKPDELCAALPDEVFFEAMNCRVAYSFDKALEYARNENKALLRVSGMMHEEATSNLVERIRAIDEEDVTFKDKFVYFFTSANSSADLADGNPSIGVFLPTETEQSGRWQYTNGRLAYGWGYSTVMKITTNDYAYAEDPGASDPAAYAYVTNQAYVATWGQPKTEIFGTTNMCYDTVADGLTALTAMAQLVLDEGWAEFCRHTQGITLTITSPFGEIGTPNPAYGLHENFLYAGDDFTAFAPGEMVTNKDIGVVLEFKGWTLTNETTGAFQKGTGTNTPPIAVAPGDNLTLSWQTVTNAVWITVENEDKLGTITPESGWHPYGASSLIAMPEEDGYRFEQWIFAEYPSMRGIAPPSEVDRTEQVLTFMATRPMVITAKYCKMSDGEVDAFEAALVTSNTLTVVSVPAASEMTNGLQNVLLPAMPSVTAVVVHDGSSKTIAMEESLELPAVVVAVSLSSDVVTVVTNAANGDGVEWRCTGWTLGNKEGVGSVAGVTLEGNATLVWKWEKVVPPEEPEEPRQPAKIPYADESLQTSPLTIYASDGGTLTVEANIGNAVKGWWYVLKNADDLAGPYEKADGADCVKLAVADGALELSTTFTPTDAKRFYKVTVEEEAP